MKTIFKLKLYIMEHIITRMPVSSIRIEGWTTLRQGLPKTRQNIPAP